MKTNKIFMLAIAAGAMFLGSCSNDDGLKQIEEAAKPGTMVFTAGMENAGDATRTVLNGNDVNWVDGDQIIISTKEGDEATFTAYNSNGTTCQFSGTLTEGTKYYAVYPSSAATTTTGSSSEENYITLPDEQTAVAGSYDPSAAVMLATSATTDLVFKNLNCLVKVTPAFDCSKIILEANGSQIAGKVKVYWPNGSDTPSWSATGTSSDVKDSVTLNSPDGSYIQAGQTYYIAVLPTATSYKGIKITFIATESDDNGNLGFAKTKSAVVNFYRNQILNFGNIEKSNCGAFKVDGQKNDTVPCVDLGLSTGALWAKTNVGYTAAKPYGDFFAWGDTEPLYESYTINFTTVTSVSGTTVTPEWKDGKSAGYCWANYPYSDGTTETVDKPYASGVLKSANDAATQKLGGNWKTPTMAQITTLRTECVWVYGYEQHGDKSISGFKIYRAKNAADKGKIYFTQNVKWYLLGSSANGYYQSTTDASCSKYMTETTPVGSYTSGTHVFLPSSGYFNGTTFCRGGFNGHYWSSTWDSAAYARSLNFYSYSVGPQYSSYRYYGRSVRGVCQ